MRSSASVQINKSRELQRYRTSATVSPADTVSSEVEYHSAKLVNLIDMSFESGRSGGHIQEGGGAPQILPLHSDA